MSWTRFAGTLSAAILAGWAASASAADYDYGRSGPYIGGGGLYAFSNFSGKADKSSPDNSWGYNLKGGYRFNEYFAVEVDWDHLLKFKEQNHDVEEWLIGANGKFYPFQSVVQPYLTAGLGWNSVKDNRRASPTDTTGIGMRFGAGVEFYVSRNWAITADTSYLLPLSGRKDYGAIPVGLGVLYRFY